MLNDEVRPQKVVVEAPFVYGSRHKSSQRSSFSTVYSTDSTKVLNSTLKTQLSSPNPLNPAHDMWNSRNRKKQREHSNSFGNQSNPSSKKPGRPTKREVHLSSFPCRWLTSILTVNFTRSHRIIFWQRPWAVKRRNRFSLKDQSMRCSIPQRITIICRCKPHLSYFEVRSRIHSTARGHRRV